MDVTPKLEPDHQLIEAYGNGGFKVAGQRYEGSVMVFSHHTTAWSLADWQSAQAADFEVIFQQDPMPEIVVIGCGAHFQMLPNSIKQIFRHYAIPVDAMDTGAACRTYNVLLAEGRRVAAALIAV
ncbi:MAG: Mth938-like domain-containing protein [Alphaproteobacteria bacterium]|nr:Mth938-like domain-containing protein [Alphaproteobacteria bacterium]